MTPRVAPRAPDPAAVAREGRTDAVSSGLARGADESALSAAREGRATALPGAAGLAAEGLSSSAFSSDPDESGGTTLSDDALSAPARARGRALRGLAGRWLPGGGDAGPSPDSPGRPSAIPQAPLSRNADPSPQKSRHPSGFPRTPLGKNADPSLEISRHLRGFSRGPLAKNPDTSADPLGDLWSFSSTPPVSRPVPAPSRPAGAARRAAAAAREAVASAAPPVLAAAGGLLAAAAVAIALSSALGSLLGFWEGEARRAQALAGLPPWVTYSMVEEALRCQEEYGDPAGCAIAQAIVESGAGESPSLLASRDSNLFGIKWASSFAACPEVTGKASWSTCEEYGGRTVTVVDQFARFSSPEACIRFRSRVMLRRAPYSTNPTIRRAVAERDSRLMAQGLKEAGWATSSGYVDALTSAIERYGLDRLDSMTPDDLAAGLAPAGEGSGAVVAAAASQIGTPYVWGGTTPGVGLDCSGLTQWCYRQAGVAIPRTSEAQAAAGTRVPLSQARPGDILWRHGHVAIYIGGDQYIHAPVPGRTVCVATGIYGFTCAVRYQ